MVNTNLLMNKVAIQKIKFEQQILMLPLFGSKNKFRGINVNCILLKVN